MLKPLAQAPWILRLIILCAVAVSCSDDGGGERAPKAKQPPDPLSEWAFQIYVGDPKAPDTWKSVKLRPVREVSFPDAHDLSAGAQALGSEKQPAAKPQGVIGTPDGSVTFPEDDLTSPSGWALVYGAAAQCGMINESVAEDDLPLNPFVSTQVPIVPPWENTSSTAWGIFDHKPTTCTESIAYSETLLCIANELAHIAETVAPVTWNRTGGTLPPLPDIPVGPWIIPPQSEKNRFIARDLAIYMLANLAVNDGWYTGIGSAYTPCSSSLAEAGRSPGTFGTTNASWLYEALPTKYYPPVDVTVLDTTTIPQIAAGRLKLITYILRSASRLLDDLIDKSVVADLAGTQQRRAHATDEARGSEVAWGDRNAENGKYNTIAHALRVIAGRWELGTHTGGDSAATFYKVDPAALPNPPCGPVAAIDLLEKAYGKDRSARVSDKSITTAGQKAALDLVQSAGIVVPPGVVDTNLSGVKTAVKNQLVETAALQKGYALTGQEFTTFTTTGQGKAIDYVMKDITDGDLTFALNKTFNQYRILATKDESVTDVTTPGAGLSNASHVAPSLSDPTIKGTALAKGIPRTDFASDVMSRVGRIQVASQCDEFGGAFGTGGGGPADTIRRAAFQDSYSIGQTISQRLVALRESVQLGAPPPAEFDDVSAVAEGAATEARAWTGPGRMFAESLVDDTDSPRVRSINLYLLGFEPSDFGVSQVSDMPDQIALVWGEPWVADCAARLRESCPADFETNYVRKLKNVIGVQQTTAADQRSIGFDGAMMFLEFTPVISPQLNFHPEQIGSTNPEKNLYAILLTDPKSPTKKGKVLGALALRNDLPTGGTSVAVSYKQWKHFNDVLAPPPKWLEPVGIGQPGTSTGPAYCIEGVPKDFFVPLENELTSDSDGYENSWRHYLDLAKGAAAKADELGQKLIDLGLQQEYRSEAANEDLAAICGDFGAAGKTSVIDGKVTAPKDDQNLANCFGEDTYDLVFLTDDPTKGMTPALRKEFVHDVLHACDDDEGSEICEATTIGEDKIAGLGLTNYVAPPDPQAPVPNPCSTSQELMESLTSGFEGQKLKTLANSSYLNPAELAGLAARLRIEVLSTGVWKLYLAGQPVMSADLAAPGQLWPECRNSSPGCTTNVAQAALFDTMFRRLTGSNNQLGFGAGNGGDAQREANEILWRVQGALWMIGAMSGSIPEGMFDTQIAAANFNGAHWSFEDPNLAPIFTVFGSGRFTNSFLDAATDTDEDRDALGPAVAITNASWWPSEAPVWLRDLYYPPNGQSGPTSKYLHVHGVNPEIANMGPTDVGAFLDSVGSKLDGLNCFDPGVGAVKFVGDGAPLGGKWDEARTLVEDARRGKSWGRVCKNSDGDAILGLNTVPGSPGLATSSILDLFTYENNYACGSCAWLNAKKHIPLFPLEPIDNQIEGAYIAVSYGVYDGLASNNQSSFDVVPSVCQHERRQGQTVVGLATPGLQYIRGTSNGESGDHCASNNSWVPSWVNGGVAHIRYTQRMLLPRACSAGDRVQAFVNSYPPQGTCAAASQVAQAVALACHVDAGGGGTSLDPPVIKKVEDLDGFVKWIGRLSLEAQLQVSKLYLEKLPKRIVDDFTVQKVGSGSYKGEHGVILSQLRAALQTLNEGWGRVHGNLAQLKNAVDAARLDIIDAKIANDTAVAELAIQRISIHQGMIAAASSLFSNPLGGVGQFANAPAQIDSGNEMLEKADELEEYAGDAQHNKVAQALKDLQIASNPLYTDLSGAVSDIVGSTATIIGIQAQLAQSQETAKYQAAKAAGADYYLDGTGQVVKIPVNTVNRRMYDLTRRRYEDALRDAKYLAYVARLAIEQRIGMRLPTIHTKVGVLEEPALWADDICSLQGVDFERLKEFYVANPESGGFGGLVAAVMNIAAESSDKFVGDYVTKLENFVEYYNIQYPSHDGDDTTVLSLRDDLLGPTKSCVLPGDNLLYYSSSLTSHDMLEEGTVLRGWETNSCDPTDGKCLRVEPSAVLPDPPELPPAAQIGGFSWLHDYTPPAAWDGGVPETGDAGATDAAAPSASSTAPPRTVSQAVTLEAGASYALSWWDQGRDINGEYATQDSPEYVVAVLAPDGQQVGEPFSGVPYRPALTGGLPSGNPWSERHKLHFSAAESGEYRVVFSASASPAGGVLGSVVIANVQLELAAPGSVPTGYENTGSSLLQISSQCAGKSAEELQQAFHYGCDEKGDCFYELTAPIVIDTSDVTSSKLAGKLAAGNFNFRHIDLAVNLVGTGVYDCTANPSQSCFASAYVEYTIDHNAFQVKVLNHHEEVQTFNFGLAGINHAKALAAERYITLPIADADKSLLFQPGVLKPEYRGRPLDGNYRLRIWDSPFLAWNRLEDVQIVLQYRYWSKIDPQPPAQ